MTTSSLVVFLIATVVVYAAAASPIVTTLEESTCPWRTVANVNDLYVQSYGSFALEHVVLSLVKVESATVQAVGDCDNSTKLNYALIIDAIQRPGGEVFPYRAVVYVEQSVPIKLISLESIVKPHPPQDN